MDFTTVSILKIPTEQVWETMLNHLPDIAEGVAELKTINVIDRIQLPNNTNTVISIWTASPQLPSFVVKYINQICLFGRIPQFGIPQTKSLIGKLNLLL
ncbi:MAG: hypothetical protein IPG60_12975 [Bacteroidetes bacterium]|nr:hypothetical protein [Bacteroidota bacterium]